MPVISQDHVLLPLVMEESEKGEKSEENPYLVVYPNYVIERWLNWTLQASYDKDEEVELCDCSYNSSYNMYIHTYNDIMVDIIAMCTQFFVKKA